MLQFEPISEKSETGKIVCSKFVSSYRPGYVRCNGVFLPKRCVDFAEDILNMDVRDDDVWVCTFPKTGTTWAQEMVWCIAHDLDYEAARKEILSDRFPMLEQSIIFDHRNVPNLDPSPFKVSQVNRIENIKSPRFIKAHLPLKLLPMKLQNNSTKAKVIYVTRNPKDTCVSFFHHCRLLKGFKGDFPDFFKMFLDDAVCFAPYWDHVLEFWSASKKNDNILFIRYEEMKKDLGSIIGKVCSHLNKSLTAPQVESLKAHLSFENMKKNPTTNYEFRIKFMKENDLIEEQFLTGKFMRSGQVGGWKSQMTPEMVEKIDEWSRSKTKGTDFPFYEIS